MSYTIAAVVPEDEQRRETLEAFGCIVNARRMENEARVMPAFESSIEVFETSGEFILQSAIPSELIEDIGIDYLSNLSGADIRKGRGKIDSQKIFYLIQKLKTEIENNDGQRMNLTSALDLHVMPILEFALANGYDIEIGSE